MIVSVLYLLGHLIFGAEVSLGAKGGEELGLKVVIRGPSKELESQDAQAKIVRWMRCKGYVVAPINQQTMIPLISRPVVFIDRKIKMIEMILLWLPPIIIKWELR